MLANNVNLRMVCATARYVVLFARAGPNGLRRDPTLTGTSAARARLRFTKGSEHFGHLSGPDVGGGLQSGMGGRLSSDARGFK
jgi:hypothetical protein